MKRKQLIFDHPPELHIRNKRKIALVISSFQPNKHASELLRIALKSLENFSGQDVSIWVVDVGSPKHKDLVLPHEFKNVNFVITDYIPLNYDLVPIWKRWRSREKLRNGSYANGWTLEYGLSVFDSMNYIPDYMMTLQMDIMAIHKDWLNSLLDLFSNDVIAVGVRKQLCYDKSEEILHSLGCLWDYKKFKELNLNLMPDIPKYDVGEKAIVKAIASGKTISCLKNSFVDEINFNKVNDIFHMYTIDKSFSCHGDIVFLHLGRGVLKSEKGDIRGKMTLEDWQNLYNKVVK
jgi:hypothetical protein